MRTNTTRQPATQPAFGKCPVGFALFRPVAVRCVAVRCGALRCGAFRSGSRRHLWWGGGGGGGVGGGGRGPALPVALVPKWASAMLRARASRQSLQVLRLRWSEAGCGLGFGAARHVGGPALRLPGAVAVGNLGGVALQRRRISFFPASRSLPVAVGCPVAPATSLAPEAVSEEACEWGPRWSDAAATRQPRWSALDPGVCVT